MSYKRWRMGRADETPQQRAMRIERVKLAAYGESDAGHEPVARRGRKLDRGMKYTLISFVIIAAAAVIVKALNPWMQVGKPFSMFFLIFGGCMLMSFVMRRRR